MFRRLNRWFLWIFSLLVAVVAAAEPTPPSRLTADYKMRRELKVLEDEITSEGRLVLGGPGKLRWETTAPARSTLLVASGKAWIQYPDLGVTRSFDLAADPVMKVLSEHLFALTAGDFERVEKLYRVESLEGGARRLVPRQKEVGDIFAEIRVVMSTLGVASRVEMISRAGDRTVIEFTNIAIDPELPESLFKEPK